MRRVFMVDCSGIGELLAPVPPDVLAVGPGFSLGAWQRESALDPHIVKARLVNQVL
jgi:hypothetical protein